MVVLHRPGPCNKYSTERETSKQGRGVIAKSFELCNVFSYFKCLPQPYYIEIVKLKCITLSFFKKLIIVHLCLLNILFGVAGSPNTSSRIGTSNDSQYFSGVFVYLKKCCLLGTGV